MTAQRMLVDTSTEADPRDRSPDYWVLRTRMLPATDQQTVTDRQSPGGQGDPGVQVRQPQPFVFDAHSAGSLQTFAVASQRMQGQTVVTGQIERNQIWAIPIEAAEVPFDLGPKIPVTVSREAKGLLAQAPWPCLQTLLQPLRSWASTTRELHAVNIRVIVDPEDTTWMELAIELKLEGVSDEVALNLWDTIGAKIDAAKFALSPEDRQWFDNHLAVHVMWEDGAGDDSSSSV